MNETLTPIDDLIEGADVKSFKIATVMVVAAAVSAVMPMTAKRASEERAEGAWRLRADFVTNTAYTGEGANLVGGDALVADAATITKASFSMPEILTERFNIGFGKAEQFSGKGTAQLARFGALTSSKYENSGWMAREHNCLAQAVYYEARSENSGGQEAVAEVVMNRVNSPLYPDTICNVVYQGSHLRTGCQFSFTCDGSLKARPRGIAWARARKVATEAMLGNNEPVTSRATHYHATYVAPYWAPSLVKTARIGTHVFYRFPSRSERITIAANRSNVAALTSMPGASLAETDPIIANAAYDNGLEADDLIASGAVDVSTPARTTVVGRSTFEGGLPSDPLIAAPIITNGKTSAHGTSDLTDTAANAAIAPVIAGPTATAPETPSPKAAPVVLRDPLSLPGRGI